MSRLSASVLAVWLAFTGVGYAQYADEFHEDWKGLDDFIARCELMIGHGQLYLEACKCRLVTLTENKLMQPGASSEFQKVIDAIQSELDRCAKNLEELKGGKQINLRALDAASKTLVIMSATLFGMLSTWGNHSA